MWGQGLPHVLGSIGGVDHIGNTHDHGHDGNVSCWLQVTMGCWGSVTEGGWRVGAPGSRMWVLSCKEPRGSQHPHGQWSLATVCNSNSRESNTVF